MSRGTTVPLSPIENTFSPWLGPTPVNHLFLQTQTRAHPPYQQIHEEHTFCFRLRSGTDDVTARWGLWEVHLSICQNFLVFFVMASGFQLSCMCSLKAENLMGNLNVPPPPPESFA